MRSSIELPSLRDHFKQESLPPFSSPRPRSLLPSILNHSPPGRSSTLPPIQRTNKLPRPRKGSISGARKAKHERSKSKEFGRRPSLGDRKALSAEPQTAAWAQGKRWEDLIEAATSATEVDDDRSEVSLQSNREPVTITINPTADGTFAHHTTNDSQHYLHNFSTFDQRSIIHAPCIPVPWAATACLASPFPTPTLLRSVSSPQIPNTATVRVLAQP
jgi:hypothetical protein